MQANQDRGSKAASIEVRKFGVKYRLLTDSQTTLKGRILSGGLSGSLKPTELWALRDIDFQCNQGEVLGIIGPNGSGKSTLVRAVAGILPPSEGTCAVTGHITPLLDPQSILNGYLSGRENAFLFAAAHRIPRKEMEAALPWIEQFSELGPFLDAPMKTYSSGMLARLSFSLATYGNPHILLVDEMLSVGDERFQRKSYFRMLKLVDRGNLVVVVSHNLAFVESVCTRALLLVGGRLVEDGKPKAVVAAYRKSFS